MGSDWLTHGDLVHLDEYPRLLTACEDPRYLRDQLLIRIFWDVGPRPAELVAIRRKDIIPEKRQIWIYTLKKGCGGFRKDVPAWGSSPENKPPHPKYYNTNLRPTRVIPVHKSTIDCFLEYIEGILGIDPEEAATDPRPLFPGKLHKRTSNKVTIMPRSTSRIIRDEIATRAGIRRKLQPRMFRHTRCSFLVHGEDGSGGLPLEQAILFSGHASADGLRPYLHLPPLQTILNNYEEKVMGSRTDHADLVARRVVERLKGNSKPIPSFKDRRLEIFT